MTLIMGFISATFLVWKSSLPVPQGGSMGATQGPKFCFWYFFGEFVFNTLFMIMKVICNTFILKKCPWVRGEPPGVPPGIQFAIFIHRTLMYFFLFTFNRYLIELIFCTFWVEKVWSLCPRVWVGVHGCPPGAKKLPSSFLGRIFFQYFF